MKKILFFLALAVIANFAQAAFVSESNAREIAESWFANRSPLEAKGRKITKSFITKQQDLPVFYTYGFENGGFVIVSADDAAEPIIGYSYTSSITEKIDHPAVKSWLDNYGEQISEIAAKKADNSQTLPMWEKIQKNDFKSYKNSRAVEPLVKSQWDQGSPYDTYVPFQPGTTKKCAVGCVATAMSQIMNYYQWPIQGQGSHTNIASNNNAGYDITANFGATTYEWPRMITPKLNSASPAGAIDAVAKLALHCGTAVDMMYGESSGAFSENVIPALRTYFKYNKSTTNLKARNTYTQAVWDGMLKAELDQKRPLYYSGSGTGGGHAFVCDGYQEADNKFHFNWGWSGNYDGYFVSNALNPQGVGTGGGTGGFNSNQRAIFDLWDYLAKPSPVSMVSVKNVGDGTKVQVVWHKSLDADVKKYKILFGKKSYTYSNPQESTDTLLTISNLTQDSLYYFGVTAINSNNQESKITEMSFTPKVKPASPVGIKAVHPAIGTVSVVWDKNNELDLKGYNIYQSSNNIDFTKINSSAIQNQSFTATNLSHTAYSYIKVAAVDTDNNESSLSVSLPVRPVTLDQGILVVDESANGSGTILSPDDAMQDAYYHSLLSGVTNKRDFDATTANKVTVSDLGAYSSIVWHNQSVELSSIFNSSQENIKKYLDMGGNVLITADKPAKLIENTSIYPASYAENSFAKSYFGIDSAYYKSAARCSGANPFVNDYSILEVDTTKTTSATGEHIKKIETLCATSSAKVIYTYRSGYPASNNFGTEQGKPVGIEKLTNSYKTVTLAMPLYFIKENEAKAVIEHILRDKFNETVGIEQEAARINDFVLLNNYPNPFNPTTTISFINPVAGAVKVAVYNVKGEMVKELINGFATAGIQKISFDALGMNSGMYFYKVTASGKNLVGKMMLLK